MKLSKTVGLGQGPRSSQTLNAHFSKSICSSKPFKTTLKRSKSILLALSLCFSNLAFCSIDTIAQETTTEPLSSFANSLTLLSRSGDTIIYEFKLGTTSNQASDVVGYELEGSLGNLNNTPSSMEVEVDASWIGDNSEESLTTSYNYDEGTFKVNYSRTDPSGQEGYGLVGLICIIADQGETLPEAAVATAGGGSLVILDNSGWKTDFSSLERNENFDFTPFPNPSLGMVNLGFSEAKEGDWRVISLAGAVMENGRGQIPSTLNLSAYASGLYFVVITIDGIALSKKIVRM